MAGSILFCITLPISLPLNNLAIAVLMAGWLLEGDLGGKIQVAIRNKVILLPILFYILHALGLLYTLDWTEGTGQLETKAAIFLLPLTIGTSPYFSPNRIRWIVNVYVGSCFIFSLFFLSWAGYQFFKSGTTSQFFYHDLTSIADLHAIYFGMFLGLAIILLLYYYTEQQPLIPGRFSLVLIFYFFSVIAMLTALVVMFILPLLIVLQLVKRRDDKNRLVTALSIWISIMIILAALIYSFSVTREKFKKLSSFEFKMNAPDTDWNSVTIRLAKWQCGWDLIKSNWIVGVGTGDAKSKLLESYQRFGFSEGIRNTYNVHCQYLASWMMLGLPGIIILILMVFPKRRNFPLTLFLLLIAASFLTENTLDTQKGVVFFSFFYGLLSHRVLNPSTSKNQFLNAPISP